MGIKGVKRGRTGILEAGLGSWRQDWDLGGRTGILEAGLGSLRQDWDLGGRTGVLEALQLGLGGRSERYIRDNRITSLHGCRLCRGMLNLYE